MNERVQKLIEQAHEQKPIMVMDPVTCEPIHKIGNGGTLMYHKVLNPEKFAELIIKRIIDNVECHASLFNTKEAQQVCSWIVKSVKYDFGVEE